MARPPTRRSGLAAYRAKRDFARTPEPAGGAPGHGGHRGGRFVVQRHRARRLHYDLRLEVGGALASWAVPKGPTLDPARRTLAVQVEDHPMEYADFEGVIPSGEYGGGDVIVWDRGTWAPARTGDPAAAIAAGELHFDLHGDKLAGRFVLLRRARDGGGRDQWLLLHKDDDRARPGWDPEDHPRSVKSGRTNDEVAAAPAALWRSDLPASEAEVPVGATAWPAPTAEELAALDALGDGGRWHLQGRRFALSHLGAVLCTGRAGEEPVTKRDLVRYYAQVGPALLPYLVDRPVGVRRGPGAAGAPGHRAGGVPGRAPGWLRRWRDPGARPGEAGSYPVPDSVAALAWLAGHGAVELRPWASRAGDPGSPTWVLFGINPGERTSPEDVVLLARLHRTALDHLGVEGAAKLSGGSGIEIWVPVRPGYTFAQARRWAETVSRSIGTAVPELVSGVPARGDRGGRARLDVTWNAAGPAVAAPYSATARPGAPVSVPIGWHELDDPELRPDRWTVRTVLDRLATTGDPLARLVGLEQALPEL